MAPEDKNREGAAADSDTSEELQVSLTNMLLGQHPVIIRKKHPATRDELPLEDAAANRTESEADFSLPESSANDSGDDQTHAPCAVGDNSEANSEADSSSKGESSDESASPCLKSQANKDTCMKEVPCLKDVKCLKNSECLKYSECLKGRNKESTHSATADSQPDAIDVLAEAASDKSNDEAADEQIDGDGSNASKESEITTENNSVVDPESFAPSSSGGESCKEPDFSDKTDELSTDASTLGEESPNGVSSEEEEPKKAVPEQASGKLAAVGSGWSVSEDHMLRGMKESEDNLSWADIGKILKRNKNDVKGRWRVIKDQPRQLESNQQTSGDEKSSGKEAESTADVSKGTNDPCKPSKETRASARPSKEGKGVAQPAKASKTAAMSKSGKDPKISCKEDKGKGRAKADKPTKWHMGQRNGKVAMENKAARSKAAETNERDRDILSGEEASSESSFVLENEDDDEDDEDGYSYGWPEQKRHDIQYLQSHVYKAMYPSMIQPEPDEFIGEHDCAVLASVDSKYKRGKWLEMQANFFNVTGRMVPLHIIRDKCERAEQDGALKRQEAHAKRAALDDSSRRENVEKWVHDLPEV